MTIDFGSETLMLLPERAIFWPSDSRLAFSDVHFGKAQSLQKAGIPISSEAHAEDLQTIERLIATHSPRTISILGDFIHDLDSWSTELSSQLARFFETHRAVSWQLILGNHERGSEKFLARLPIEIIRGDLEVRGLTLAHGHRPTEASPAPARRIEGHVHPVFKIREGSTRLRLPCFVQTESTLILPAFGALTGGFEFEPNHRQKIFAVTPGEVFEVKGR